MNLGLQDALAKLARAAPQEWALFVGAYREHHNRRQDMMLQATPDVILIAQGMARETADFVKKLAQALPE